MDLEEILNDYTFDYESGSANSYMVVRNKKNVLYKNYQVEMIANNTISGLLPLDLRQKNNITGFYYNITSKISLSQYISHKKLSKKEFINLLSNIVKTLLECRKYLLSSNSFLVYEDYLFINPSTQEVFLMYLPVEQTGSLADKLKKFTLRILIEKAKFDESSSDNFLQKILEYIREESFSVNGFYSFLNTLRSESYIDKTSDAKIIINDDFSQKPKNEVKNIKQNNVRQKIKKDINEPIKIPNVPGRDNIHLIKADKVTREASQKDSRSSSVLLAVLVQILVIILYFLGKKYLMTVTDDAISAYVGTGLTLFALDLLVMRKIFDKREEQGKAINASKRSIVSDINIPAIKEKIIGTTHIKSSQKEDIPELNSVGSVINQEMKYSNIRNDSFDIKSAGMDETAVLCEKGISDPYLSYKHDGVEERINISKSSFIIGRLQGQVDYICTNNAVGKVHAEILSKGEFHYLKDLNSRNGSFLNGEQVVPNKENEIKSGDRISLANSDFTFFAPASVNG